MEIDRSLIGTSSDAWIVEVERGAIRRFAEAIGDDNPLWRDAEFARSQGYPDVIAPPSFPVSFVMPDIPPWWEGLDRKRFLAGEHGFSYTRPITVGDVLRIPGEAGRRILRLPWTKTGANQYVTIEDPILVRAVLRAIAASSRAITAGSISAGATATSGPVSNRTPRLRAMSSIWSRR